MKQVRESAPAKRISAYIICDRKGRKVATVQALHSDASVQVDIWHVSGDMPLQQGRAAGYGYDKFTSALGGLSIDGHKLSNHCAERRDRPRGKHVWPANTKAPRGYTLSNYCTVDAQTGKRISSYDWQDMARATLGATAEHSAVKRLATDLELQASAAGTIISGYTDCYKLSGLEYLSAIGYNVYKAI